MLHGMYVYSEISFTFLLVRGVHARALDLTHCTRPRMRTPRSRDTRNVVKKMVTFYKREESFDIFESNELPVLQVLFILKKDG